MARDDAPSGPRDSSRRATAGIALACLVVAVASLALPFYLRGDQWAWLIWGRQVAHLGLDTVAGPSWKPLPVIFTTVLSVFGPAAPALWLVVARTAWLTAMVLAFRLGSRLAGRTAGIVAVVALLLTPDSQATWFSYFATGRSEALAVAAVLGTIDRHIAGRRGQALVLAFVAALDRPVAWPFLAAYALLVWRSEPRWRIPALALLAAVPVLWFGGDLWGSGSLLTGARLAQTGRAFAGQAGGGDSIAVPALPGVAGMVMVPVWLAAAGAVASALRGRRPAEDPEPRRLIVALGLGVLAWDAIVVAMAAAGFPVLTRFTAPAAAVASVLAGVGVAGLLGAVTARRAHVAVAAAVTVVLAVFAAPRLYYLAHQPAFLARNAESVRSLTRAAAVTDIAARLPTCADRVLVFGGGISRARRLAWTLDLPMRVVIPVPATAPVSLYAGVAIGRKQARLALERAVTAPRGRGLPVRRLGQAGEWGVYEVGCRRRRT